MKVIIQGTPARRDHAARMVEALRYEPCSPTCPNWLRYGVQPKGAKAGMMPGQCRGKAHKPEHGSNERQRQVADKLDSLARDQLTKASGTQRARKRKETD
ncbi:hypothetical protein [Sphaerisporangium sp. NBC_01403]|uniref:hypothetical protein n=1 Tax=Sphaerisporangium sp. NBC_01403 TaxID=2903599 RepID=UPI00386D4028